MNLSGNNKNKITGKKYQPVMTITGLNHRSGTKTYYPKHIGQKHIGENIFNENILIPKHIEPKTYCPKTYCPKTYWTKICILRIAPMNSQKHIGPKYVFFGLLQ